MAISEELKQHLIDVADESGANPDELIAEVEAQMASAISTEAPAATPPQKAASGSGMEPYEPYAYPFLTVNEIRACLGLPPSKVDGDLYAGEWLKKYGGAEFLAATT